MPPKTKKDKVADKLSDTKHKAKKVKKQAPKHLKDRGGPNDYDTWEVSSGLVLVEPGTPRRVVV